MAAEQDTPPWNVLQRLDLALAARAALRAAEADELALGLGLPALPEVDRYGWVAALLSLRGLLIDPGDVAAVARGQACRFAPEHHEHTLIAGMCRVHSRVAKWARIHRAPDGWSIVELFREFTRDVARFRNNALRRDVPWDAILYVEYPACPDLAGCLDGFGIEQSFRDHPLRFDALHPVRQAFRVLWRFARIAPFPDFNLTMAWIAMDLYLAHRGYPMLTPRREDRELLHRLVAGPAPLRVAELESRLLGVVE